MHYEQVTKSWRQKVTPSTSTVARWPLGMDALITPALSSRGIEPFLISHARPEHHRPASRAARRVTVGAFERAGIRRSPASATIPKPARLQVDSVGS